MPASGLTLSRAAAILNQMARSAAQRLFHTAILLPVLLFAVSNLRSIAFLCSMSGDGLLRADCCCPKVAEQPSEQSERASGGARVATASCCQLRELAMARPPSELPRVGAPITLDLPAFSTWALVLAPPPATAPAFDTPSPRPPPAGTSLLLFKQTLLL